MLRPGGGRGKHHATTRVGGRVIAMRGAPMLGPEMKQTGSTNAATRGRGEGGWGVLNQAVPHFGGCAMWYRPLTQPLHSRHLPRYLWLQIHSVSQMSWQTCRYEATCSNQCCNVGASCDKGASKEKACLQPPCLVRWNTSRLPSVRGSIGTFALAASRGLGRVGGALREPRGTNDQRPTTTTTAATATAATTSTATATATTATARATATATATPTSTATPTATATAATAATAATTATATTAPTPTATGTAPATAPATPTLTATATPTTATTATTATATATRTQPHFLLFPLSSAFRFPL